MHGEKDFSRLEYRRIDAWPRRLQREWPFLSARLAEAPDRGFVLDLGCGSGEHSRFLVERGYPTIGIDRSADALELARAPRSESSPVRWLRADLGALPLATRCARLALCLGNTVALLGDDENIRTMLEDTRRALRSRGILVVQVLNYHRLRSQGIRFLPINFRREDASGNELVYLRLMDFDEPKHVSFHVVTLERAPGEEPVEVRRSVRRRLRSIEYTELRELLTEAGFGELELFGDYEERAFEPDASTDVIAVARA